LNLQQLPLSQELAIRQGLETPDLKMASYPSQLPQQLEPLAMRFDLTAECKLLVDQLVGELQVVILKV
jgi:hypothetical protein